MADHNQNFEMYDGNGCTQVFNVGGNMTGATASWKAKATDGSAAPWTVAKTPTVGAYDADAGTTPVTLTIETTDFDNHPGMYNHELVLTLSGVPKAVADGWLTVRESLIT